MLPRAPCVAVTVLAQACTAAFFVLLAWTGISILEILASDRLVSLPEISVAWVNSVIPITAVLFLIAQVLMLPDVMREARSGRIEKAEELI